MKIAATVTICVQVAQERWDDINTTRVFDSSDSIDSILEWASKHVKNPGLHDLKLSEVDNAATSAKAGGKNE